MQLLTNEEEILRRAKAGDLSAFHQIYRVFKQPLFSFIYRMTGDKHDAEDLLQEVFVKAYQGLRSFEGKSTFSTWLFSIAKNETVSFLRRVARRNGRKVEVETAIGWENQAQVPVVCDPEDDVLEREADAVLQQALNALPETYRSAFVLGVIEGLPYEQVGEILGCSVPNVKSRVFRARAKLAQWLAKNYPEFGKLRAKQKPQTQVPNTSALTKDNAEEL